MGCEDDAGRREGKLTIKHLLTLVTVLLFTHLTQAEPSARLMQRILKATNKNRAGKLSLRTHSDPSHPVGLGR
jgi:ribosomal protein L2